MMREMYDVITPPYIPPNQPHIYLLDFFLVSLLREPWLALTAERRPPGAPMMVFDLRRRKGGKERR